MLKRELDLTSWSALSLHRLGSTESWKQSIDLKVGTDLTPGWTRLKLIVSGNTIRRVSLQFRGKLDETAMQEHFGSSESRFAAFIFVSPDISCIRIDLYLARPVVDRFSATVRRISLPEYLYKTRPHSLRSLRKGVRYFYDAPFLCAITHAFPRPGVSAASRVGYGHWIDVREPRIQANLLLCHCRNMAESPAISVLMPLSDPKLMFLREAIDSVRYQTYANWTLRIVGARLNDPDAGRYLSNLPSEDPRISVSLSDSQAPPSDIRSVAFDAGESPFVTTLNQHDVLARRSLELCAGLLSNNPSTEVVYTDHDVIDHHGRRCDPAFKPDFSLDLLYSYDYISSQIVHRAGNFQKAGGWREPLSPARDYDLMLRILESIDPSRIAHIPAVLYHRRPGSASTRPGSRPDGGECFRSALAGHLARRGVSADVLPTHGDFCRVVYDVNHLRPTVSIIIPTRDQPDLLETCVRSILTRTTYQDFEIIIVDNGSVHKETHALLSRLASGPRVKVLPYPFDFNFAAINNFARRHSDGAFLCFLNDDTEVIDPDWLHDMLGYAIQPGAGCVGAKLLYPDRTVQHAGIILGVSLGTLHAFVNFDDDALGYGARLKVASNFSALTGACLLLQASIFDAAGGFDEIDFPITYNDVDLCIKVEKLGYRNILTPFARLYHRESQSRGYDDTVTKAARLAREYALLCTKHGDRVRHDPFYSPNLSDHNANFELGLADHLPKDRPDLIASEVRWPSSDRIVDCFLRLSSSRSFLMKQFWRRTLYGKRESARTARAELVRNGLPQLSTADRNLSLTRGVALYGQFRGETGLGQAVRRAALALATTNVPVSRHAISAPLLFVEDVQFDCVDSASSPYDTALMYLTADTLVQLPYNALLVAIADKRRIGFWHWELPVFPAAWVTAIDMVHEIFAPSRFVAESVATATNKPIRVVPHAVPISDISKDAARGQLGLSRDDLLFLNVFDTNSYLARKNPTGIIRAFLDAFPDTGVSSPRLVLKYHGRTQRGSELDAIIEQGRRDHRIILIDRVYSSKEMELLHAACDAFVSLHRSEGYGLNIAESMASGKITIATAFSGNLDFMTADNSILVPYSMRKVAKGEYLLGAGQWWAEPDHSAAVEALRSAAYDPALASRLGARARLDISRNNSYERVGDLLAKAIRGELTNVNAGGT